MNEITYLKIIYICREPLVCTCGSADFNNIQETKINFDTVVSILMVI